MSYKKMEILLRLYSTKEHTAAFPLASNPAEEISLNPHGNLFSIIKKNIYLTVKVSK